MHLVNPSYEILSLPDGALKRIELAGRVCYKSEDRITDESAEKFVRSIVERGHLSVIEHASLTVKFVIDRGVSHELVRHRLCSFSQESTRYCNYGKKDVTFVIPPWCDIDPGAQECNSDEGTIIWFDSCIASERDYLQLLERGWSPQMARSVLPNSLKTEIIVTANLREWLHIFDLRCAPAAHPQMRQIMIPLRDELKRRLPAIFGGSPMK